MGSAPHLNQEGLDWVVQKFGGTSVGKFPDKVSPLIIKAAYELKLTLSLDCP